MAEKKEPMTKEEDEPQQDFFMETDKKHKVSYQKPGFQIERGKLEEKGVTEVAEGITNVKLPKSTEDIPSAPLSERFHREEKL
ncbi:hypothetical protein MSBRW_2543 [Methanosarcina barkeri str. Wiesmoor]|uniref:Uncharacterized protein n=2 Tax=Methanosarcina barkeri TaxID=2208 RepID=A0A0E3LLS8_METBA|nr:hypothetical protein [Methanosarcina barkeri]AKB51796.1 hypothetical protein MSBRW_2543 [Methanosarcina barkeri str. Wiesmoor]